MVSNTITMILGIAIVGICSYTAVTIEDWRKLVNSVLGLFGWEEYGQRMVYMSMGLGVLVFLLSLVGFFGAYKQNKQLICVYLSFMYMLGAALIFGSIMAFFVGKELGGTSSSQTARSISNIVLYLADECCMPLDNSTAPACLDKSSSTLYSCYYPLCDGTNAEVCSTIDERASLSELPESFRLTIRTSIAPCNGPNLGKFIQESWQTMWTIGVAVTATVMMLYALGLALCCTSNTSKNTLNGYPLTSPTPGQM